MKRTVTLKVETKLLRQARILAAETRQLDQCNAGGEAGRVGARAHSLQSSAKAGFGAAAHGQEFGVVTSCVAG